MLIVTNGYVLFDYTLFDSMASRYLTQIEMTQNTSENLSGIRINML